MPSFERLGKLVPKVNPGPVPTLDFEVTINWTGGGPHYSFLVLTFNPSAELCAIPLPVDRISEKRFQQFPPGATVLGQGAYSFRVVLYPHLIAAINAARTGDVKGTIELAFRYLDRWEGNPPRIEITSSAQSVEWIYSRDEWNDFLGNIGYEPGLVIEVPLPALPQWDPVRKHLEDARVAYGRQEPLAVCIACRAAWMAAKPELAAHWQEAKQVIDRGSRQVTSHLPKSERVALTMKDLEDLLGSARYLADASLHLEEHEKPSWAEAVLVYHLTLSLLSFASKAIRAQTP